MMVLNNSLTNVPSCITLKYRKRGVLMTVSLRLSDEDEKLFKSYAKSNRMTLSEFIRNTVLERIEDEYDLKVYREAVDEFKKDPTTYTLDEMKERLGIE